MIVLLLMKGRSAKQFTNMFMDSHNLNEYSFKEFKWNLSVMFQPADIWRKSGQELANLRQKSTESIKDFILWFQQCVIKAQYNTGTNSRFLIQLLHNIMGQDLVEFVEISQIHLIDSDNLDNWVHALIQAEQIKTEQKAWKGTSITPFNAPAKSWTTNSRQGNYVSLNYKGNNPIANFSANKVVSPPAISAALAAIYPNQTSTFGGQGTSMDISKAHTEGKYVKCSKQWPCKNHIRKCVICQMTFKNQQISYTMADELTAEISCIEKDFPIRE